ncbi:DNA cytosine methyltransferase [Fusobacterium sp.]|uniref:DNA cytosine methyltransferase n=1 Tax=Fusobacterium sp. TaxID=68766 RepID=UPI0028FE625D|nr:DNA cytosine methyltransferase [Fusobacterium sp.]MDU1911925.1 DNA cytosine methyltransferase [Fusobacterium sp.]
MYNVISLFSGAMGLDIGAEKAGATIKVCIEKDKFAAATIRRNTKIPVIESDINEVSSEKILEVAGLEKGEVFAIIGGPPCQPFSYAGKQLGLGDFRANTMVRFLNIIEEIRPKFFLMENVRGLLTAKLNSVPEEFSKYENIKELPGSVLKFLKTELKNYGYTVSFALLNAANYGVPQKRERMILFGYYGDERISIPRPTHSENSIIRNTLPWKTLREALKGLKKPQLSEYNELSDRNKKFLSLLKEGENWTNLPEDLKKEAMGGAYYLGGGKTGFYRRLSFSQPSPTLVTVPTMPATMLCHPTELRPLSIKEYARIQEFPDNWIFEGKITEIYKQIGNAVPIGLGYIAMKTLIDFYEEKNLIIKYSKYKNTTDIEFDKHFEKIQKKKNENQNQLKL